MKRTSRVGAGQAALRGYVRLISTVLTFLAVVTAAVPVAAQTEFDGPTDRFDDTAQPETNGLWMQWIQNADGGDDFEFYGVEGDARTDASQTTLFALLRQVGVERQGSDQVEYLDGDRFSPYSEVRIHAREHLVNEANDWRTSFDFGALARRVSAAGYESFTLELCPLPVKQEILGALQPSYEFEGCPGWETTFRGVSSDEVIEFVEHPDSGNYWNVIVILAVVVLLTTAAATALTLFARRRWLDTLSGTNLLLGASGVVIAASFVTMFLFVFGLGVDSVSDLRLIHGLNDRGHALAVFLPSLLTALPALVPALLLVAVKPRLSAAGSAGAGANVNGVPSWLYAEQPESADVPAAPPAAPQSQPERAQSTDDDPPPPPPPTWNAPG